MKRSKFLIAMTIALSWSLISMRCEDDSSIEIGESTDQQAPEIVVISPNESSVFYTEGGIDTPDYVVINAEATDISKIGIGSVTIYNASGDEVAYYEETSSSQNGISITEVYTSFSTLVPGDYTLKVEFQDIAGNISTETRHVTCVYSEPTGGTDT